MNILMLTTSYPREHGSWVGVFVHALARALQNRHTVRVLAPGFPGSRTVSARDGVAVWRFRYALPSCMQRVTYPGGIPDQLKTSWLARLQFPGFLAAYALAVRRHLGWADVVVCNWALTGWVLQAAQSLSRRRPPHLVVVRGSDMALIEHGGPAGRLLLGALRRAGAVCTVTPAFVAPLRANGIARVYVTPNGLDFARFGGMARDEARREVGLEDGGPAVLYAGSLIERKDVATLVEAMQGVEARLVVIGDGPRRAALERRAAAARVRVHFAGLQPPERMAAWYAAADVFALPSRYEGRPNALLEAMASGLPSVAADIAGTRELMDLPELRRFLFPPGDVAALRERIESLLRDAALRAAVGAAARRRAAAAAPGWDVCAAGYEAILDGLSSSRALAASSSHAA